MLWTLITLAVAALAIILWIRLSLYVFTIEGGH